MKLFTRLALVSAVAVSGSAMAMESMDDSALSSATGQDGITLGIAIDHISIQDLFIHDNDGLSETAAFNGTNLGGTHNATVSGAGAITISGNGISGDRNEFNGIDIQANPGAANANIVMYGPTTPVLAKLTIDSDAGTGANGAFLNIGAEVSGLDIAIGKIGVAKSNAVQASGAQRGIVTGSSNTIITGLTLKTGKTLANIQLGATPQGAMIDLSGSMAGGLEISNLGIKDNAGGGAINLGKITLVDAGGTDLSTNAKVSIVPGALKIEAMSNATDMYISTIKLGESTTTPLSALGSIGDVEVRNMQVSHGGVAGAVILVSGH